jgi:hypothetical protein
MRDPCISLEKYFLGFFHREFSRGARVTRARRAPLTLD